MVELTGVNLNIDARIRIVPRPATIEFTGINDRKGNQFGRIDSGN